jgi:NAD(P)-dependent dehydrogenase (short-subunit alcohol dehydrogenase family)
MGFATARCLANDGARVAVVGRTKDVLDRAAKDLLLLLAKDENHAPAGSPSSGR